MTSHSDAVMEPERQVRDFVNAAAWVIVWLGWPPIALAVGPGAQVIDGVIFLAITSLWAVSPVMAARAWGRTRDWQPTQRGRQIGFVLMGLWALAVLALIVTQGPRFGLWAA